MIFWIRYPHVKCFYDHIHDFEITKKLCISMYVDLHANVTSIFGVLQVNLFKQIKLDVDAH